MHLCKKTENFNIIQSGDIWLSESPYTPGSISFGVLFPDYLPLQLLSVKENKKIFVINCHLDHMKNETGKSNSSFIE